MKAILWFEDNRDLTPHTSFPSHIIIIMLNSLNFIGTKHAMNMPELVNAFYLPRGEPPRGDPG
jgi:hypothetical protein